MKTLMILLAALSVAIAAPAAETGTSLQTWPHRYHYVAFSGGAGQPVLAGRLSFPEDAGDKVPAVIITHGSGGVDSRGPAYARRLNDRGIATLEIDMWSARGLRGGLDRPGHVRDTLPDAWAARDYLRARDDIRADAIGLLGFSWGGVMAMLAASDDSEPGFAALAALYPVCWGYNRVPGYDFTRVRAGKLLVVSALNDDYDDPGDCERLLESLPEPDRERVDLLTLPGATHAFDRRAPAGAFEDPYAYRGAGGNVDIRYSLTATKHALHRVSRFFTRAFNTPQAPVRSR